jgi:serine/threonine protein kinase
MRFCRYCGRSLEGIFCPLCQRANQPGLTYCAHCGTLLTGQAPDAPYGTGKLPPGMVLSGRYLIVRKIAQGGMGAVYEAKALLAEGQRLAIKEMSFSMLKRLNPDHQQIVLDNFHREFDLLSKLSHPNLVQAYRFFEEQGRQYYVMEYIEGMTLEAIMESEPLGQLLPVERVMDWAKQLCNVLHYLHSQKPPIIYRDLKPSNVMEMAGLRTVKLFDFGIARFYKPGQKSDTLRFGTEGFLAPEIVAYQSQTSELTDVYALGALLHQLLTRHDPQIDPWRRPPICSINPYVSEHVARAIDRALMLDPSQRTRCAMDVYRDLFEPDEGFVRDSIVSGVVARIPEDISLAPAPAPARERGVGSVKESIDMGRGEAAQLSKHPAPVREELPVGSPAPLVPGAPTLYLGLIPRGKVASGAFQVVIPSSAFGQVKSNVPWLVVSPEKFSSSNACITVHAHTMKLPFSGWRQESGPAWYTQLPGFFRNWLYFHLKFLVPQPRNCQGQIQVVVPGAAMTLVQVGLEVSPSQWRTGLGWAITIVLMTFEIVFLLSLILILALLAIVNL